MQAWEFKHPSFLMNNRSQLDNIRRKAPATRKTAQKSTEETPGLSEALAQIEELKGRIQSLDKTHNQLHEKLAQNDTIAQGLVAQVREMHGKMSEYEDIIQSLVTRLAEETAKGRARKRSSSSLRNRSRGTNHMEEEEMEVDEDDKDDEEGEEGEDGEDGEDDYNEGWDEDGEEQFDQDGFADELDRRHDNLRHGQNPLQPIDLQSEQNYDSPQLPKSASVISDVNYIRATAENRGEVGTAVLEIDELLDPTQWTISPFNPGGLNTWEAIEEMFSLSKNGEKAAIVNPPSADEMFESLLSRSVAREDYSWRKLPDLEGQTQSKLGRPKDYSAGTETRTADNNVGLDEQGADANETTEPMRTLQPSLSQNHRDDTLLYILSKPRNSEIPGLDQKDTQDSEQTDFHLQPLNSTGNDPPQSDIQTTLPAFAIIKRQLNVPKLPSKRRRVSEGGSLSMGRNMERRNRPSRYAGMERTHSVLVVDDDPVCRRLLLLFFNSMRQEVDLAVSPSLHLLKIVILNRL